MLGSLLVSHRTNPGAVSNQTMTSGPKYKKAPDAPKRFKSAFIIFSAEKHREIKEDLASKGRAEKVSSRVVRRDVLVTGTKIVFLFQN